MICLFCIPDTGAIAGGTVAAVVTMVGTAGIIYYVMRRVRLAKIKKKSNQVKPHRREAFIEDSADNDGNHDCANESHA